MITLKLIPSDGGMVFCVVMPPNQFQHAEYERRPLPDDVVGLTAELHKAVQPLRLLAAAGDEVLHLRREDEWRAIPVKRPRKFEVKAFSSVYLCLRVFFVEATVWLKEARLAS